MTAITAERLTPTVGALVDGVDREQMLQALPTRAAPFDPSSRHRMHRTTFAGDAPIP